MNFRGKIYFILFLSLVAKAKSRKKPSSTLISEGHKRPLEENSKHLSNRRLLGQNKIVFERTVTGGGMTFNHGVGGF